MPIILITPPVTIANELNLLNDFLHLGLPRVHLRKPGLSLEAHDNYIQQINPEYRTRISLHDFHELSQKFSLGGIHYRSRQLPDLVSAPTPSQIVSLSFHNPEDLLVDRGSDIGYCFLSPIYNSISKKGYGPGAAIADRKKLAEFVNKSKYPAVALGGVVPATFSELAELGFAAAALLGSIWDAENPLRAMEEALEADAMTAWLWKRVF